MRILTGLLGGVVAGLIGAAAWAAVGHFLNYELGILAWGIGVVVGLGVALGTSREGGALYGVTAAAVAIGSIMLGKWMWLSLALNASVDDESLIAYTADIIIEERIEAGRPARHLHEFDSDRPLRDFYAPDVWREASDRWKAYSPQEQERYRRVPSMLNPHLLLVYLADGVVIELQEKGETIEWPGEDDITTAWRQAHYPTDIWAEAERRWNAWSPEDQQAHIAWVEQQETDANRHWQAAIQPTIFFNSFDLFDALWILLAVGSAYGIAAGTTSEE